jgi:uncharacterized protein involved in response to NO
VPASDTAVPAAYPAILNLGFRLFFSAAAGYSLLAMLAWTAMYQAGWHPASPSLTPVIWHAHEMIFGYGMAVIAGFLLTAVRNWTGIQTLRGYPLLLLALAWLAARVLFFFDAPGTLPLQVLFDGAFELGLIVSLLVPVLRARQWKQLGILSKLVLLLASNLVFYAGLQGLVADGVRLGLYSGVYLVIALILVMASRVFPFFIERGVGFAVRLASRPWLDGTGLALFLAFWLADLARPDTAPVFVLALALTLVHSVKLAGWYTPGIWTRPLLWVLYLGYGWIVAGFALKAAVALGVSPLLSLHAFAVGGIGMITLGMMARVSLGHTGRDVAEPPAVLFVAFTLLLAATAVRVLLPLLAPAWYRDWVGLAQLLWLLAFALFLVRFLPILARPRVDGQPG